MSDVLPKSPEGGADPLADGLQRFTPCSLLGHMATHTRRRAMIHSEKESHRPILVGVCRRHSGLPHRIDLPRDDVPSWAFGPCGGPWRVGASR